MTVKHRIMFIHISHYIYISKTLHLTIVSLEISEEFRFINSLHFVKKFEVSKVVT